MILFPHLVSLFPCPPSVSSYSSSSSTTLPLSLPLPYLPPPPLSYSCLFPNVLLLSLSPMLTSHLSSLTISPSHPPLHPFPATTNRRKPIRFSHLPLVLITSLASTPWPPFKPSRPAPPLASYAPQALQACRPTLAAIDPWMPIRVITLSCLLPAGTLKSAGAKWWDVLSGLWHIYSARLRLHRAFIGARL